MIRDDPRQQAIARRDAALVRAGRARRLLIGASAAVSAAAAWLISTSPPVKAHTVATSHRGSAASATSAAAAPALPPLKSARELGLRPPHRAPSAAPQPTTPAPSIQAPGPQSAPAPAPPSEPAAVQPAASQAPVSGGS